MYYKAQIEILIEVDDEASACDALCETLRPLLKTFDPASSIIDWRYADDHNVPVPDSGDGFEYADDVKFGIR